MSRAHPITSSVFCEDGTEARREIVPAGYGLVLTGDHSFPLKVVKIEDDE